MVSVLKGGGARIGLNYVVIMAADIPAVFSIGGIPRFLLGIDRRTKSTLIITDCNNANSFAKVSDGFLSNSGKQLKEE